MNKIIFFLPGLVIGLLSNKVVNENTQSTNSVSTYKKISNIQREYTVESPNSKFRINDFTVEASSIMIGKPVTIFVDKMPGNCIIYYDILFYDQYGKLINFERYTRPKDGSRKGYYKIEIKNPELYRGYMHLKFQLTSFILGIDSYVYGECDMYLSGDPCDEDIKNMEFYCPYKALISQQKAKTITYGEYFKFTNLKSTIEVDKYGTFYFNDLKLNLYREYYNSDVWFKGNIQLEHEYDFFFEGNANTSRSQFIELKRTSDDKVNCTFQSSKVMYVNPTNNFVSLKKSNNSIETNDFYFPLNEYDKYKETTFYLFLYEWGYSQLICRVPFKVKFLKDDTKYGYEIIGEIDEKVDDSEMEEVRL